MRVKKQKTSQMTAQLFFTLLIYYTSKKIYNTLHRVGMSVVFKKALKFKQLIRMSINVHVLLGVEGHMF